MQVSAVLNENALVIVYESVLYSDYGTRLETKIMSSNLTLGTKSAGRLSSNHSQP